MIKHQLLEREITEIKRKFEQDILSSVPVTLFTERLPQFQGNANLQPNLN